MSRAEKLCSMCGEVKPLSCFGKRADRPGYKCYCKPCKGAKDKVYKASNPKIIAMKEERAVRKAERERVRLEKQEAEVLAKQIRLASKPTAAEIAEKKRIKCARWTQNNPKKAAAIRKAAYEKRVANDHEGLLEIKRKSRRKRVNQTSADQFFIMAGAAEQISKTLIEKQTNEKHTVTDRPE